MTSADPRAVHEADRAGGIGAVVVLAVGVGLAALVDFAGIAGQGARAGEWVLATAPWVLVLRSWLAAASEPARRGRIASPWVLLLIGGIAHAVPPVSGSGWTAAPPIPAR